MRRLAKAEDDVSPTRLRCSRYLLEMSWESLKFPLSYKGEGESGHVVMLPARDVARVAIDGVLLPFAVGGEQHLA